MYLLEHDQVSKTILTILVGRCVCLMCGGLVVGFWLEDVYSPRMCQKQLLAILYACDIKSQ